MDHNLEEISSTISQFKIPGWKNVTADQIKVTPIGDGFINTTLKVERSQIYSDEDGPKSLVFKKYGGNIFVKQAKEMGFRVNPPYVQSLIFYELSKRGWGPKLHGLFEDGRIEEFVDCHTLRPQEAFSPDMSRDLARAYARFHSLKLPINQEPLDMFCEVWCSIDQGIKQLKEFVESKDIKESDPLICFKRLLEFPFQEEGKWVNSLRGKVKQRTVLSTIDPNYLNRLVRHEQPKDTNANRILIIDFDGSSYSHRGYDLGGHFANKMFYDENGNLGASGQTYPSEAERKFFLTAYLEEAEKLFDDFDKSSLDSLDNLTLECDLHALSYLLFPGLASFLKFPTILDKKPHMADFVDPGLVLYNELKKQFCAKYPSLIAE